MPDRPAAIIASQMTIGTGTSACAALQLGPDNKIYLAKRSASQFLPRVINDPNTAGLACNFVDNVVPLAGGTSCSYGLPNFFQGYFNQTLFLLLYSLRQITFSPGTCTDFNDTISQFNFLPLRLFREPILLHLSM